MFLLFPGFSNFNRFYLLYLPVSFVLGTCYSLVLFAFFFPNRIYSSEICLFGSITVGMDAPITGIFSCPYLLWSLNSLKAYSFSPDGPVDVNDTTDS